MNAIEWTRLHVAPAGRDSSTGPRHGFFPSEWRRFSPPRRGGIGFYLASRSQRAPAGSPCRKQDAGATLVEFTLVVMVLMAMTLGIIDFSRALYVYHFVDHAAKSATRWAAVNGYACAQDGSCPYGPTGAKTNDIATYISACGVGSGSVCGATANDIENYVTGLVPAGIVSSNVTTSASWPVQSGTSSDPSPAICSGAVSGLATAAIQNYPGCTVEVTVSYPFNFLYPFIRSRSITLSSTSEMVIAH